MAEAASRVFCSGRTRRSNRGSEALGTGRYPSTGQMVLYGGLLATGGTNAATRTLSLSLEFDFLDTRPTLDKWTWSAAINSVFPPPALYQPIMLYLPNQRQTLVMGGCNGINPVDGNITQCVPFSAGYLINSMVMTGSDGASVPMSRVDIKGGPPAPRLSPCTVVLASGDVFMYGGATASGSLGDAWVLNTSNWTWISKSIKNMPFPGRAGAACQLATADQIIMVGGFNGPLMGPKQFSEPQVAIINTTSWAWASDFIPSMETTPPSSLSQGVVIAIIVSGSLLLAILLSIMGRLIWQRRKRPGRKQEIFKSIRASKSSEPLMESDCYITESEVSATPMVPFSTAHLANNSIPGSISQTSLRLKEREPFLIIPYAPDTTMTYDSGSTVRMDLSTSMQSDTMVNSSVPMRSDLKISTGSDTGPYRPSGNNGESFVKGYQLPQTLADIQHGQYVKTLQHQKQYERRRRDLEQQSAHHPLHRQSTQYSFQEYDAELDGVDLATGMVHLREVDVGEEPISEAWDGIDDEIQELETKARTPLSLSRLPPKIKLLQLEHQQFLALRWSQGCGFNRTFDSNY
ncbi:hypothetical protein EDD11_004366 [Mortierella claussenii]|nr:hypothetical protein EDD11_004366 [Mortierella claussenii]